MSRRLVPSVGFALLIGALALPAASAAQGSPRAADVQLRAFAATVIEMGRIHDEVDAQLARPENKTVERQADLKVGMKQRIARAIKAHGLTQELFDQFQYLVTTDEEWRAFFERRLASARGSTRPPR